MDLGNAIQPLADTNPRKQASEACSVHWQTEHWLTVGRRAGFFVSPTPSSCPITSTSERDLAEGSAKWPGHMGLAALPSPRAAQTYQFPPMAPHPQEGGVIPKAHPH